MFNNKFSKRYKNIPIAKYTASRGNIAARELFTLPEIHKEFEMILIKEGAAELCVDNEVIIAHCGDLIFINPYILHSLTLLPCEKFNYTCICFDLSIISNPLLEKNFEENIFCILHRIKSGSPCNKALRTLFCEVEYALDRPSPYRELAVCGNINLMFALFIQNNFITDSFSPLCDKNFCISIIRYIEKHFRENITSETAAKVLGYNQSYFCRLFRRNFSMCFGEFLNIYRLEKSKRLLENPSFSVTDISYECGFPNPSYFGKLFRKHQGMSPRAYRNAYSTDTVIS